MCITSKPAHLIKTKIGLVANLQNRTHTLLYQNAVENRFKGANCMILPILGNVRSIADTTNYNRVLDEVAAATKSQFTSRGMSLSKSITVHEVGKYTVIHSVFATPTVIAKELEKLPENKRPDIAKKLLKWYLAYYGSPELILCCFDSSNDAVQPISVTYTPRNFSSLFFPGADSHDGSVPNIGARTDRDHTLLVGLYGGKPLQKKVHLSQHESMPKELSYAEWLFHHQVDRFGDNGDWMFQITDEEKGELSDVRLVMNNSEVFA